MTNLQSLLASIESRFDAMRPTRNWVPNKMFDGHQESEQADFGYKWSDGIEIHEVTDWGNIKKFIKQSHEEIIQAVVEEIDSLYFRDHIERGSEFASPRDYRRAGNNAALDELKAFLSPKKS